MNINDIVTKSDNWLASSVDGELVLMNSETGGYYTLNKTGTIIMEVIGDGPSKVQDIVSELLKKFEIDEETCLNEVIEFLNSIKEEGIIKSN